MRSAATGSLSVPLPQGHDTGLHIRLERCPLTVVGVGPGEGPVVEVLGRHLGPSAVRFSQRVRNGQSLASIMVDEDEGAIEAVVLRVPRDARLWIEGEVGPVTVRNLQHCYLSLETEVGGVELLNVTGHLHVSTEVGPVRGEGVGGRLQVETEVGPILLRVLHLDAGRHEVETEVGPINIELAPGLAVGVRAECESGPVHVGYPPSAAADVSLVVSSELGPIRVGVWPAAPGSYDAASTPGRAAGVAGGGQAPVHGGTSDEVARILHMVQDGVLTAAEANELLHELERG